MRPIFTRLSALGVFAALASGCVYRMNIQQGNYLEGKTVAQLQVGMTRSQVRYLLGTPMVPDAFDKDRWDYLYYFQRGAPEASRAAPPDRVLQGRQGGASFDRDNVPAGRHRRRPTEGAPIDEVPRRSSARRAPAARAPRAPGGARADRA